MKPLTAAAIVALLLAPLGAGAASPTLTGFSPSETGRELAVEAEFVDIPSAQGMRDTAAAVAARPHYAGTSGDHALALDLRDRLRAAGLAAEVQPFTARVDSPRLLHLELAPPADSSPQAGRSKHHGARSAFPVVLDLGEPGEPSDPPSGARGLGLPFHAGSADGDVSAPLVYANRGVEGDYATLAGGGIDVRGTAVLVRSGAEPLRGLAERAQAHGAVGAIFYSDPQADGAARGPVYPDGPWRPATSVERGWVGTRVRIPTLPVSAANAQVLLGALRGPAGPTDWAGGLPVPYPLARGPGRVHLVVRLSRKPTTLWNTVATLPGLRGDQSVIIGAPRDAWVYGVADDGAGVTALVEVARGLGFLWRGGWRPQRTIVIAGWDGEELGSAGSRAYARAHLLDLQRGCVGYLDARIEATGPIVGAVATAPLAPGVVAASRAVPDPVAPGTAIYTRWAAQAAPGPARVDPPDLGAGPPPLAEAGTPVVGMTLRGPFGVAKTSDDTLGFALRYSDPDFSLHRAAAQLDGILTLRLADAAGSPYVFAAYLPGLRSATLGLAARAARAHLSADFTPLRQAIAGFAAAAARYDRGQLAGDDRVARGLRAVRELDSGSDEPGAAVGPLGPIDSALGAGDAAGTASAIATAAATIGRASAALGR